MNHEDSVGIATPEGVEIELVLAGVGSRFVAALLDWLLRAVVLTALATVAVVAASVLGGGWATALQVLLLVALFCALFVYDVCFEVWANGQTPGKRWTGLRVVRTGGGPVGITTSAIRNLLRPIDFLPSAYLVGVVAIVATPRNQRLGDLAAGTLVVREGREPERAAAPWSPGRVVREEAARWDVSTVTACEVAAVTAFLERRAALPAEARSRIARELAERLWPKVGGAPTNLTHEGFLERVAAAKAARGA